MTKRFWPGSLSTPLAVLSSAQQWGLESSTASSFKPRRRTRLSSTTVCSAGRWQIHTGSHGGAHDCYGGSPVTLLYFTQSSSGWWRMACPNGGSRAGHVRDTPADYRRAPQRGGRREVGPACRAGPRTAGRLTCAPRVLQGCRKAPLAKRDLLEKNRCAARVKRSLVVQRGRGSTTKVGTATATKPLAKWKVEAGAT